MNELLARIESYRIFNYLYPGVLFLLACSYMQLVDIKDQSLISTAFVAYFAGMTISQSGAILLEGFLRWTGFVNFAAYGQFVRAEKTDNKIRILNEEANTFRTIAATMMAIVLAALCKYLLVNSFLSSHSLVFSLMPILIALYLFAYRRQVKYIVSRVKISKNNQNTNEQSAV